MNYVADVAILDRGDAPAQAVLDRTARSLAQRVADETRDELQKVMSRVDRIYGTYEKPPEIDLDDNNLHYANDLKELEELLQDAVKKKKYQHKVTIFIVGYENVCGQKLRLLQQVNEFFMDNANKFEEEETEIRKPDFDMDEAKEVVEDTLATTESLAKRLGDINKEMAEYMYEWSRQQATTKSKKKLERSLAQARDEITGLGEKLSHLSEELEEKEDRIQQMFKQIELKNMEAQRYKTAAEVAKRSAEESDSLRDALAQRDEELMALRKDNEKLRGDMQNLESNGYSTQMQIANMEEENAARIDRLKQAMDELRDQEVEESNKDEDEEEDKPLVDEKRELQRIHESQIEEINKSHKAEVEELKTQHEAEIKKLLEEKEEQERSRASQKEKKTKSKGSTNKIRSRSKEKLGKKFSKSKDVAEVAVQDNNGDPNTATVDHQSQPAKRGKNLEPVFEEIEFDDVFDLQDEESWSSVPPAHILSRFKQYRSLTSEKLQNYDDQMDSTIKKTQRKIETLKAQFHEHKKKWEHERQQILQEIEAKENLQRDAERQADRAIAHLEEFITEQEILEQEEEKARQALESGAKEPIVSLAEAEQQLAQTIERHSAEEQQINDMLLAQTDDAKAEMSRKNTQFEDKSDLKIDGNTHDEILRNSAMSRASLRSQHKEALQVLKSSAEERRTKSPGMQSVRSQKSVLSELELDEDGDMPFPPDESKEEKAQRERKLSMHDIATSPMAKFYRKQIPMYDHPVVQEFLKAYDVTTTFKDNLGSMFTDKEILIAGQLLSEIETVRFDKDDKVQPQLEQMTNSIMSILEETYQIIASVLSNERDYPVSSLYNLSRDPTRSVITRPNTETRSASGAGGGNAAMDAELKELHQQYLQLQKKFDEEAKKHTEQLHHNTVIMMEMQDTINTLQRELNTVSSKATVIPESAKDTPIMFTRLDSERNAKMLKRGVNENRVDVENYQQAVETMDAYVNIPRKRLASLAQKYSHHVQMKEIEENVRNSRSLDDKVFDILDKMEALQNERAKRWAEKMDEYAAERTKLANMLMVTLDELERQSGIFLIKPMFSYRSKPEITQYHNKMSRPYKPARSPFRHAGSAVAPVPTPASMRPYSQATVKNDNYNQNGGLMGQQTLLIGDYGARPVWNPNEANGKTLSDDQLMFLHQSQLGTPKILELDINRMLIGQNQISMNIPPNVPMSNDRLVNAANTTTRAYVTVNRPTGNGQKKDEKRPRSHKEKSDVPPTTPMRSSTAGSGKNVKDDKAGRNLPATPPLPPITPRSENEAPYPPASPPGSSLRQTPADNLVSQ